MLSFVNLQSNNLSFLSHLIPDSSIPPWQNLTSITKYMRKQYNSLEYTCIAIQGYKGMIHYTDIIDWILLRFYFLLNSQLLKCMNTYIFSQIVQTEYSVNNNTC